MIYEYTKMTEIEVNTTCNVFSHNYPTNSFIQASQYIHGKVYHRSYDIISLGHYLQKMYVLQKRVKQESNIKFQTNI